MLLTDRDREPIFVILTIRRGHGPSGVPEISGDATACSEAV